LPCIECIGYPKFGKNTSLMSTNLQIFQLLRIKIFESMVELFIIVAIDIEIHFFINIISISARIEVILLNKRVKQTFDYIKNTLKKTIYTIICLFKINIICRGSSTLATNKLSTKSMICNYNNHFIPSNHHLQKTINNN
jgi:hypothetical protein